MDSHSVQPLRISKTNTPSSTPNKMAATRPLSEIGSTERRRNSPSYNQVTRNMVSPYTETSSPSSPPPSHFNKQPSPRDFWSGRDSAMSPSRFDSENTPEQRSESPALPNSQRRSSIEKLKQASRVKNSNIFALESKDAYDPNSVPVVERPSANRPLSESFVNNSFARFDSQRKENTPISSPRRHAHKRSDTETNIPFVSPSKLSESAPRPTSSEKHEPSAPSSSPTKSSLSRTSQFGLYTGYEDGEDQAPLRRGLHRHNKSVTFHEEPPVVNEYEQQTPEPSVSVASDREGSWDSDDFYDEDVSYERYSSAERDPDDSFDEDLENTDKTPVVLPEDWSRMSPDEARTDLVDNEDNVFDNEDEPTQRAIGGEDVQTPRVASDGESRPLPPLPGFMAGERRGSNGLSSAGKRSLPGTPQGASCSKEEIMKMASSSSLSLQERLQLMGNSQEERPTSKSSTSTHETEQSQHEELTITNLDTGEKSEVPVAQKETQDDADVGDLSTFEAPRISRESILRNVRNSKYDFEPDEEDNIEEESEYHTEDGGRPSIAELARMDPDQAIPSRESSRDVSDSYEYAGDALTAATYLEDSRLEEEVKIKDEPADGDAGIDMDSIPAAPRSPSRMDDYERQNSVLRHDVSDDDNDNDSVSRYSSGEPPDAESTMLQTSTSHEEEHDDGSKETLQDAMQMLTVKDYSEPQQQSTKQGDYMGLPAYLSTDDYDFGMKSYITPSPPPSSSDTQQHQRSLDTTTMPQLQPPAEIFEKKAPRDVSPPDSPNSVIHNGQQDDTGDVSSIEEDVSPAEEQAPLESGPIVPERIASIKTPGGELKARRSVSRSDAEQMAQQRRLMSEEEMPAVPAIPQQYQEVEAGAAAEEDEETESMESREAARQKQKERRKSRKSGGRMDLGLDTSAFSLGDHDGLGLEDEFERVIEGQKKGYLMRQNTKLVVASNRNFSGESSETAKSNGSRTETESMEGRAMSPTASTRPGSKATSRSANSSPRKESGEQFLKTEPWNGKVRRKSSRNASALRDAIAREPAPPLPGQESALGVVDEDYAAGSANLEDDVGEGVERGRLFVKVVGVKELDLPVPRNDRLDFQLTLDNGLHCVTTSSLELGRSAPIGQEFELVVLNDLEFQLTLTTQLPAPPAEPSTPSSSSPAKKHQKSSSISRFLSSPKKRAEKERQEREAAQAEERRYQEELARKRASRTPNAWELLHKLVDGGSGSFARAYVNLKAHEKSCFGRQLTVDVPCYNEWAQEVDPMVVNSVRSKRGAGPVRRPPYVVGLLELQLLYVPTPRNGSDEQMPKSMSAAVREMGRARETREVVHEGHLSQQGGDCIHWRRRHFRLQGPKLTAYHEHTHQKRAVINLTKASRLVDDKTTLVANPSPTKKGRRKSAFAEEDEGYQYVEEGFRIRFANGETIDFYADSRERKDEWMEILSQVIGKADPGQNKRATWTDLVLAKERSGALEGQGVEVKDFSGSNKASSSPAKQDGKPMPESFVAPPPARAGSKSAPNSPQKGVRAAQSAAALRPATPPMKPRKGHRSREAVKSMIF